MSKPSSDHDFLFGLLALLNGLVNQGQLVAAFQAWTLDKSRPLAEHQVSRGDLEADDRLAVEALVARHLRKHGGDVEKSLAAVSAGKSTRESLAQIGDPDLDATLEHVPSPHVSTDDGDADRTPSYAVGSATSDGQRFRVLRPHARGGLGAVFVALDGELNREVALKQILDHYADDPTSRQRFLVEAEITGGLEHPGIVPVYGLGTKLADDNPGVSEYRSLLASGHNNLAILLCQTGKPSDAGTEYRRALAIRQKLADDNPAVSGIRSSLADSHNGLAVLLASTGRLSEAEPEFRKALSLYRELADDNPAMTEFRGRLALSHNNLGDLLSQAGKQSPAEAEYRNALAILQKLSDANPAVTDFRDQLAHAHTSLGDLLVGTGKLPNARREHRKALELHQTLADAEPRNPNWRRGVGQSLANLGDVDTATGRFDAAVASFQESRTIHERLTREHPTATEYRVGLADALTGLGRALHYAGRGTEATEPLRRAVALREAIPNLSTKARRDHANALALLASVAADPRSGLSASAPAAEAEADRAIAALRQAIAAGYRDFSKLNTDPDLAPLRSREDFRLLLMDLALPAEPFAP